MLCTFVVVVEVSVHAVVVDVVEVCESFLVVVVVAAADVCVPVVFMLQKFVFVVAVVFVNVVVVIVVVADVFVHAVFVASFCIQLLLLLQTFVYLLLLLLQTFVYLLLLLLQTFVYLFAPICRNIKESDFNQNLRLQETILNLNTNITSNSLVIHQAAGSVMGSHLGIPQNTVY